MRTLILGAGAIGGYYGAHLAQAGADVTFLVRPRRAEQIARDGLVVHTGGATLRQPVRTLAAGEACAPFDLVLVACKAFDLESAMAAVAPAMGPASALLPVLNGIAHFDALDARFGAARVLGGVCLIATVLTPDGEIRHLSPMDTILFGPRDGAASPQADALAAAFARTPVAALLSSDIVQDLWDKWVMLSSGAALTCLMRGNVGAINATQDGAAIAAAVVEESRAIATGAGHAPRPAVLERTGKMLGDPHSSWSASMMRDIEQGAPRLEADHVIGDLLRLASAHGVAAPMLRAAYCHLQVYAARQAA